MGKIKGWTKALKYESRYTSLGIYGSVWENDITGDIVWVDSVEGGGGVAYILRKNLKTPKNLFGPTRGFRTQQIAKRYVAEWMREHPRG